MSWPEEEARSFRPKVMDQPSWSQQEPKSLSVAFFWSNAHVLPCFCFWDLSEAKNLSLPEFTV